MNKAPILQFVQSVGIAALVSATGCFDAESTICPTGITCPPGTTCAAAQAVCILDGCGDGIVDIAAGEQCDDGNKISGDGCSASCKTEGCGNGIVDVALGERCDDGNNNDGDGCSADCKTNERCGNGIVDVELGEVCDDGNNTSGDGCSADCLSMEECGNGYIDLSLGEECEPTLPLPSSLTGIVCGQNCRFASTLTPSGNTASEDPAPAVIAKQCRLALSFSVSVLVPDGNGATQPGTLPGRIVSNRGSLSCTPSHGVTCVSDPMDCGGKVTLVFLPDTTDADTVEDLAARFDWGVEGCGRAENMAAAPSEGQAHALWCDVPMTSDTTEMTLALSYDESRNQPEPPPPPEPTCTLRVSLQTASSEAGFPGTIISDRGGIACGTQGSTCTAEGLECSGDVTLRIVLDELNEDTLAQLRDSFFWNVPGCYPALELMEDGMRQATPILTCKVGLSKDQRETAVNVNYAQEASPFRSLCATAVSQNCGYASVDTCVSDLETKLTQSQTSTEECSWPIQEAMDCIRWEGAAADMCFSGTLLDKLSDEHLTTVCGDALLNARRCIVAKPAMDTVDLQSLFRALYYTTQDALFGRTEVTVGQFQKCLEAGACHAANVVRFKTKGDGRISNADAEMCNLGRGDAFLDHPINCVDRQGAADFCAWMDLSLPTSDHWEIAATRVQKDENSSDVSIQDWPWGSSTPTHCVEASYQSYVESPAGSGSYEAAFCNGLTEVTKNMDGTSPVGTFQQGFSFYGLADLTGNVWEWTDSPAGSDDNYIVRGGSWSSLEVSLMPSNATKNLAAKTIANDLGFRCAQVVF